MQKMLCHQHSNDAEGPSADTSSPAKSICSPQGVDEYGNPVADESPVDPCIPNAEAAQCKEQQEVEPDDTIDDESDDADSTDSAIGEGQDGMLGDPIFRDGQSCSSSGGSGTTGSHLVWLSALVAATSRRTRSFQKRHER